VFSFTSECFDKWSSDQLNLHRCSLRSIFAEWWKQETRVGAIISHIRHHFQSQTSLLSRLHVVVPAICRVAYACFRMCLQLVLASIIQSHTYM